MSLSKGGLSSGSLPSGPSERPDADGEPSVYAPKWARESYGASQGARPGASSGAFSARKVVPLRMPAAPQLAPVAPPAPARPAAPVHPSGRRPTGPELLAEDEVLKRLLQRAPDPKPLVARPARDPVGLALGMVARLIVAGCAVAVATLLLLGVIPLPFRFDAASDTAAPGTMTLAAGPSRPATSVTTVSVRAAEPAPAAAAAPVAQALGAQAPGAQVAAAQAAPTDRGALDAGEVERLVKRGEAYLAQGDIAAARLILGRAAAAHDPRAALSLGATYDPAVLGDLHVVGFKPDVGQARAWYQKAAGYGSPDAAARLAALPSTDH